jgi:uncharacterized damage-inducible protein DinB
MKLIDSLIQEFEHETQTTRKHLVRLPNEQLGWRPHEKSFTVAALGSHITEMVGWTETIFKQDEFNFDPATYKPFNAASVDQLLQAFDDRVAEGKQALATTTAEALEQLWSLKIIGKTQFERPKAAVFRDFTLSHMIHHRGQLTVYLRLLNIPVPSTYGPSADEQ